MIGIDGINATGINMCQYFLWKRRELAGGGSDNERCKLLVLAIAD